ncbi:polynucleotide 3'-phosphatase ZDP [Malania oleifera]|uniref:polynucleotide 3'-phosphatase ZDP n=1 Tax=Malania oleifera TaxID=397392 RepID=UPI0025AE83C8|nr:polynucleotide 3'-phosphatase ZDP [Malania oleifera]
MLSIANLSSLSRYSSISLAISFPQNPSFLPLLSNRFLCNCVGISSMASPNVVVEYAKSNRSSCKKCSKAISANALRLGLRSKDPRGFDMTKWHHLDCFPRGLESITSVEAIKGFSALKSDDQEALKRMVDGCCGPQDKISDGNEDIVEESVEKSKKLRIHKLDENEDDIKEKNSKKKIHKLDEHVDEVEESNSKKIKLSIHKEEAKLEIAFSVSDIKNTYKDATLLPEWKAFETIIFLERDDNLHDSRKIAAFDFDGCLAKTSVKRIGPDAWSLMYRSIPDKLQSLYNDGYKLVIFTNESNIERWKNKRQVAVDSKIGRLNNFIKHVKVPMQVFIACGIGKSAGQAEDCFRKPKPGMWQIMVKHFNSGIPIDMDQSFYVGDAAGRKDDHSDADIEFAKAVGLKFFVPEEYFGV